MHLTAHCVLFPWSLPVTVTAPVAETTVLLAALLCTVSTTVSELTTPMTHRARSVLAVSTWLLHPLNDWTPLAAAALRGVARWRGGRARCVVGGRGVGGRKAQLRPAASQELPAPCRLAGQHSLEGQRLHHPPRAQAGRWGRQERPCACIRRRASAEHEEEEEEDGARSWARWTAGAAGGVGTQVPVAGAAATWLCAHGPLLLPSWRACGIKLAGAQASTRRVCRRGRVACARGDGRRGTAFVGYRRWERVGTEGGEVGASASATDDVPLGWGGAYSPSPAAS